MTSEIKVDTISEQTSANGVTIDGLTIKDGNIQGSPALVGTTPSFTIGDGGAEDTKIVFDGNALDYYIGLDDSADDLVIGTGSTVGSNVKITIDSSGNIGLGSTSPDRQIDIESSSVVGLRATKTDGSQFDLQVSGNTSMGTLDSTSLLFTTNNTERARFDTSGNFLVGTTATTAGNEGLVYFNGSSLRVTRDSDEPLNLDRRTNDGAMAVFQKDGTPIGNIGVSSSDFVVQSSVSDKDILFKGNDGGSTVTALTLDMSTAGKATFNNDIALGDSQKAVFGASEDLQIYHDGSNSIIKDAGTGSIEIQSDGAGVFLQKSASEYLARFLTDGSVDLYYDNVKKLETTADGISVSGLSVLTSNTPILKFIESDQSDKQYQIGSFGAAFAVYDQSNTEFRYIIDTNGNHVFNEGSADCDFRVESNANANRFKIDGGDDVVVMGTGTVEDSIYGAKPALQLTGTDFNSSAFSIIRNAADASSPNLIFGKSRSADGNTVVQNGDDLGNITFAAADGTDQNNTAARIYAEIDGAPGANDTPGRLVFATTADGTNSATERLRIDSGGHLMVGQTSTTAGFSMTQPDNNVGMGNICTNGSYSSHMNYWQNNLAGATTFNFLICISNAASSNDTEFRIQGSGATQSDGSYSGSGVDFGEYFEWADGNSSDEVRYGYSVVLDGNKIRKATSDDTTSNIIGIISAHPTIVGDGDIDRWNKKYLRDDFNKSIMEEFTLTEWTETTYGSNGSAGPVQNVNYHTDNIPDDVTVPTADVKDSEGRVIKTKAVVLSTDEKGKKLQRKKLNPDWDSTKTYVPREERKEWDVVGLVGKLRMHKGQPTNPNWKKMRDISDTVEEWLVR